MRRYGILLILLPLILTGCQIGAQPPGEATTVPPTPMGRTQVAQAEPSPSLTSPPVATNTRAPTAVPTSPPPSPTAPPSPMASPSPTVSPSPTLATSPTLVASATAIRTLTPVPTTRQPSPTSSNPTAAPASTQEQQPAVMGAAWNMQGIGHTALSSRGWYAALALKDHCAYIGSYTRAAVTMADISDPLSPKEVPGLPLPTGAKPVEVRTLPGRNLLVVADLGLDRIYTFDIADCTRPAPLGSIDLPGPPHEFYLWTDGTRVLAYAAMFDHAPPALVVVDLTDPRAPKEVGRWSNADEGAAGILHSLSVSPDGKTAYLALWRGGFLELAIDLPRMALKQDASGRFSPAQLPNTHSAVPLRDPRYVLLASEVFQCPFNGLAVVDAVDPAHPKIISRIQIPENRCRNLPAASAVFTPHNPLVVGDLAFVSWYSAGVQVFDLSNPQAPQRIGQYVPRADGTAGRSLLGSYPVQTFSYPILRNGLIYVADSQTGLHILRYTGPRAEEINRIPLAEGNVTVR